MPRIRSNAANAGPAAAPSPSAHPTAHPTAKLTVAQIVQQARHAGSSALAASPTPNPAAPTTRGTILSRKLARRAARLQAAGRMDVDPAALAAELGTAVPIGPAVIELLTLAYRANVPAILIGPHGVGKSEIAEASAAEMKIGFISRDLSLMEPPDLVGLPQIKDGTTSFLPPEFLPREIDGKGLFLIEEINRAPRYMQSSCLELLTSRRLNSYKLPDGFLPIACINPKTEGYIVDLLDRALMSRFMRIEVTAAPKPWVAWARKHGIHPRVIEYVESVPNSLDESKGGSNPRSWSYASKTLLAAGAEMLERSPDTIVAALNGIIGPVHTTALLQLVSNTEMALRPADVVGNWQASKATMMRWVKQGRLDLLATSMRAMLQWVRPESVAQQLQGNVRARGAVRAFFRLLPGDLAEQSRTCLTELGYTFLIDDASSREAL
jgi:hypothetical protein